MVVIKDPRLSRRHALIRAQQDGFWFFDLGSVNGSYLNGRRITTSLLLKTGDEVKVGTHFYRFEGSGGVEIDESSTAADATIVEVRSHAAILLVCDIQGFTTLSEKLDPNELAPIIGSWYGITEQITDAHGATLDKFLGDCALAYWLNTTIPSRLDALRAAHAMQRACDEVQHQHAEILSRVGAEFRSGTAIHMGPTAYGAFSSQEFTLLGDAVNLVFRLESLTRDFGERVLVSSDFLEGWEEGRAKCRSLGSHEVKGRTKEVEVYALEQAPD